MLNVENVKDTEKCCYGISLCVGNECKVNLMATALSQIPLSPLLTRYANLPVDP